MADTLDKAGAIDVIEDCLTGVGNPLGRGVASGTIGAFYMAGLICDEEWKAFLARIPAEPYAA